MKLTNIKDCSKCSKSVVYGSKDACEVRCESLDYVDKTNFKNYGKFAAAKCKGFEASDKKVNGIIKQENALDFLLAGQAEFNLHSTKTNDDFKFKLDKRVGKTDKFDIVYFVHILHGNDKDYAGHMWYDEETKEYTFDTGTNGLCSIKDLSIRSLLFVLNKLQKGEKVGNLEIYHLGKCGNCGRVLEDSHSIETGLHNKCIRLN